MTLVVGSTVALRINFANPIPFTGNPQRQPPEFGIVVAINGPPVTQVTVLWPDGHLEANIPIAALDEIVDPTATGSDLVGHIVRRTPPGLSAGITEPSDYDAMVVVAFRRNPESGQGTTGVDKVLVRTIHPADLYREFPASEFTIVR